MPRLPSVAGIVLLVACLLSPLAATAQSQPTFPALSGRVVDEAGLLDDPTETRLVENLAALEAETGDQFVVVTVSDLQGYEIEDYGHRLGRAWGIGQSETDSGVLLIVAPTERKVRIEVGYGLEPILTDAFSSQVIQTQILPAFRTGGFQRGIWDGAEAVMAQLRLDPAEAEARAAAVEPAKADIPMGPAIVVILVFGFLILGLIRAASSGGRRRKGRVSPILIWAAADMLSHAARSSGRGGGVSGGSFGGGGASAEAAASVVAAAVSAAVELRADGDATDPRRPRPHLGRHRPGRKPHLRRNLLRPGRPGVVLSRRQPGLGGGGGAAGPAGPDPARLRSRLVPGIADSWEAAHMAARDITVGRALAAYAVLQAAVFIVVFLVTCIPVLRRWVTPRSVRRARVRRAALQQFLAHGLHTTERRTGVLIFAALSDHQVEVIADSGIHARVDRDVWAQAVDALTIALKAGRAADGFEAAVTLTGGVLAEHFPPRPRDRDELPNRLVEL